MLLADFEWNSAAAEEDFRKAIELNPNNVPAHHWYAMSLAELGRFEEALGKFWLRKSRTLYLQSFVRHGRRSTLSRASYDEAINQCRAALDLEANFEPALYILAQTYASQHRFPEAVEAAKKYAELSGDSEINLVLAYVYAAAGMKSEAETIVRAAMMPKTDFSRYEMATVCAASHDVDGCPRLAGKGNRTALASRRLAESRSEAR